MAKMRIGIGGRARACSWGAAAAVVVLGLGCGLLGGGEPAVETAVMEGADLVLGVRFEEVVKAPIWPGVKALAAAGREEGGSGERALVQQFLQGAGIAQEDVREFLLAADVEGFDQEGSQFDDLDVVAALGLTKPLPLSLLRDAMAASADAAEGRMLVEEDRMGDTPILIVGRVGEAPEDWIYFAQTKGDKLLLMGSPKGVRGGLERARKAMCRKQLPGDLQGARARLPEGSQAWAVFALPESTREQMERDLQKPPSDLGMAMMAPVLQSLTGLRTVSAGIRLADAVEFTAMAGFGSADQAGQFRSMTELLIGLAKMAAAKDPKSPPPAFLETLQLTTTGSDFTLSFRLTEADLEALGKMSGAGALGAPPGPGAEPEGPPPGFEAPEGSGRPMPPAGGGP